MLACPSAWLAFTQFGVSARRPGSSWHFASNAFRSSGCCSNHDTVRGGSDSGEQAVTLSNATTTTDSLSRGSYMALSLSRSQTQRRKIPEGTDIRNALFADTLLSCPLLGLRGLPERGELRLLVLKLPIFSGDASLQIQYRLLILLAADC